MYPDFFQLVAAEAAITTIIGLNPVRCYPAGRAPQGSDKPYVVWQVITGLPENYLNQTPDIDSLTTQIDVYAETLSQARLLTSLIRDLVEQHAHIVAWRGEDTDAETLLWRISFDADWFVNR